MAVSFTKFVDKNSIVMLNGTTKVDVINELVAVAAELTKTSKELISQLTWKRERLMTTGVGGGLALPHIRLDDIFFPTILIGVCKTPIDDYETQDDEPVSVIVYIAAPSSNQQEYLQLLRDISGKFKSQDVIDKLVANATDSAKILEIIKS